MSPKESIEKEIASKLKAKPKKAGAVNAVVELDIKGDNGGVWTIDCTKGGIVSNGSKGGAKLVVTMSDADFVALYKKELDPASAFFSGKIKVKGDMGLAMKLGNLF